VENKAWRRNEIDHYARYSSEPQALRDEICILKSEGFIRDEIPATSVLSSFAPRFLDFAQKNIFDHRTRLRVFSVLKSEPPYVIHLDKIDPTLFEILAEERLAHIVSKPRYYSGARIDAATGIAYMMFLANEMADGRPIVTDDSIYLTQNPKMRQPES